MQKSSDVEISRPWGWLLPWQLHFERHVLLKFDFLLLFGLYRIVILTNKYFDNLERFYFKDYDISDLFQLICDVIDTL